MPKYIARGLNPCNPRNPCLKKSLECDRLVLWYECLHDAPTYQVGYSTDTEYYHVSSRLAFEAEELEGGTLIGCPGKELTRTHVDGH